MTHAPAKSSLWHWANVYKVSSALFALLDTGVLHLVASRPRHRSEIERELGLCRAPLDAMIGILADVGVVHEDERGVSLDGDGANLLPLVALEARMAGSRINHGNLASVLRGTPPGDPMVTAEGAELWPTYLEAMNVGARSLAPHLVRFVRPRSGDRIVDLGGADGGLAYAIGGMVPGVRVTVVDRPLVEPYFERRCSRHVAQGADQPELAFVALDLRHGSELRAFADADVVIASNLLHLLGGADRDALIRSLRRQMRPGAKLVIYDQFVAERRNDSAAFLVLDWLLCGYRFDFTEGEFARQLAEAGWEDVATRRVDALPGAMLLAVQRRVEA